MLKLCFTLISLIGFGYSADDQPELTQEMKELGLKPYLSKQEIDQRIYLVDDKQWEENLTKARNAFSEIEQLKKVRGEVKELIPLYWNLSKMYDYGPANKLLRFSFSRGDFGLKQNLDWGLYLGSMPQDEYDMNLIRRDVIGSAEFLTEEVAKNSKEDYPGSGRSSCGEETLPNMSFGSAGSTPPKQTHFETQPVSHIETPSVITHQTEGLRRRHTLGQK
ncbi:MAG: hypothetical protein HEEMFOPI_01374 [Holosporales bacterium]